MDNPLALIASSEAADVAKQVLAKTSDKATVLVEHQITARGSFARNDIRTIESEAILTVNLTVNIRGKSATGATTLLDPEGLADLVQTTEEAANANQLDPFEGGANLAPPVTFTDPPIYHESSVSAADSEVQGALLRQAAEAGEAAGYVSAGTAMIRADFFLVMNSAGFQGHSRKTYGEFSMTARGKNGKASGWAWAGGEDFARVDPKAIATKAIDLCRRSDNPVAVEPGRYTVILEPEAVAQIMGTVNGPPTYGMSALMADQGMTVYSLKERGNKIGLKMTDERVQIFYDPKDPDVPFSPLSPDGTLYSRNYWFEKGVLKDLAYHYQYAKRHNRRQLGEPGGIAKLVVDGPQQTLEEMIAATKRGIWVHRFAGVGAVNMRTLLLTGVTRDGTFLIENGRITKPIKNLRFNESPFFILNKIDAFGPSVRGSEKWAVPRLKVHDFEFTSLSDAI
jgi:predicted Zn-dependent protease